MQMEAEALIGALTSQLADVKPKASWGETSLFYNPKNQLPNGVYFCTIKQQDSVNDSSSSLDRAGVYRVAIGLKPQTYAALFGPKPARPAKGGIVSTGHDFTALDTLMPHPIYGWMSWAQVLAPTTETFDQILPHIVEAYACAVLKFRKKIATLQRQ